MSKDAPGSVISDRLRRGIQRSLRPLTQSAVRAEDVTAEPAHTFSHVANSGEMNHMGRFTCDACDAEMHIIGGGDEAVWQCAACGHTDAGSFRICTGCGKKTVPDKWAASARYLPVSLNAGGCTDCQRCVLCDGQLAIGNLVWQHGRWTHGYPSTEFDRKTGEEITVTRERTVFYGFHAHQSCALKNPAGIAQAIASRAPLWYTRGQAEQERTDTDRLHRDGKCLVCRNPLSLWDKLMERDTHKGCKRPA